jgi:hypothetical protein
MIRFGILALLATQAPNDIDAFMEKVLERRDINWEQYHEYFCRERAELVVEGSLPGVPLQGAQQEFLWFVRDGYFVRSPVSADGVAISREQRDREETKWIERVKKRERERRPDREGFMGFKFEPGNYFLAGKQQVEGRELLVVEYYPQEGFSDDDEDEDKDEDEADDELEAKLNNTLVVTMLIDPEEHQIVRMTLDNYGFDFLPGRWLVQLDTFEASMVMHKPFEDVWLPRDITGYGKITTAAGSVSVRYTTTFYDYAKAETSATFRFPARGINETKDDDEKPK